ncbi:hypothetical protein F5Y07DRAFT_382098 [Xylaria sp. FL0933]|nr:hypothetical protein F5Y07DRAFT_382098 [Xylaria sp. FL0933]
MKLIVGLTLFSLVSLAWQTTNWHWRESVGELLSNPYSKSRIPQFILDARHPWIIENQSRLESLPDAGAYLCSVSGQSTTDVSGEQSSAVGNGLDLPPDLFDYVEIDNIRGQVYRPGWSNALSRAQEIQRCPAALSQVKTFLTRIDVYDTQRVNWGKRILEPAQPPSELPSLFADILGNMTSLETLKWDVTPRHAHYFEESFLEREFVLPSVTRLEPRAMSHFLVQMCPNITSLVRDWSMSLSDDLDGDDPDFLLIRVTMFAPKLKRFAMMAEWSWTDSLVQELVSGYMPGIESLSIWGDIGPRRTLYGEHESDGSSLKKALQLISSFQNLTELELSHASGLGLGWKEGPACGNAYFGRRGREYQRQVYREELEAMERAGALVVEVLPRLTSFSVGSSKANITRSDNGTLRAIFPWTGWMDEWIMDLMPETADEYDEWLMDDMPDLTDEYDE